jgi:hypothetical protein
MNSEIEFEPASVYQTRANNFRNQPQSTAREEEESKEWVSLSVAINQNEIHYEDPYYL